jgi:hypothetical protein
MLRGKKSATERLFVPGSVKDFKVGNLNQYGTKTGRSLVQSMTTSPERWKKFKKDVRTAQHSKKGSPI